MKISLTLRKIEDDLNLSSPDKFYSIIYLMKSQYNKIKLRIRIPSILDPWFSETGKSKEHFLTSALSFPFWEPLSVSHVSECHFIFAVAGELWYERGCSDIKYLVNHNNNLISDRRWREQEGSCNIANTSSNTSKYKS